MTQLFKNNAQGALVAELSKSGTLVMLAAGHGARFPAPTNGDHFLATLVGLNVNGQEDAWEIVKCTGRATDGLTIARAQEGTTARTWPIGTRFEMRVTAGTLDGFTTTEQAGQAAPVQSVAGKKGAVTLSKGDVGLGQVDNTADTDKPVSKAVQQALAGKEAAGTAATAMEAHVQELDPHSQYQTKLVSGTNIKTVNGKDLLGQGDVVITGGGGVTLDGETSGFIHENKIYTITNYSAFSQYTAQASAGQASIVGNQISLQLPNVAGTVTLTVGVDGTETQFNIQVKAAGVQTPQGVVPAPGALLNTPSVTLASSEFTPLGAADTHASSDWQISTDSSFSTIFKSTSTDAANKTSWSISGLQANKIYFWRVRYHGVNNGTSGWSTPVSFQTAAVFFGSIGEQGAQGFGVGVYPGALPEGFSEMDGTRDKASANYGNYTYTDGSVMVFIPRFYYRFSDLSSPRYPKYGRNAIDVVGIETFADEASANAAGYVMHRAFKDGGQHKAGFFIDKYLASKNEDTGCKSVKESAPISLTNVRAPTRSAGMSTTEGACGGNLSDAVLLARSRGIGRFNCASIFMYGALAFLSFAHAQASTSTAYCAWYNEPHNFPKGCNDGALRDINDSSVQYALGEQHASQWGGATVRKPQTGGCDIPAKVAHNGQLCGVMDLNGVMHEVAIGVTAYGVRENDRSYYQTSREGCLKESVALASLTHGWGGATDVWQSAAGFGSLYETLPNGDFMGSESGSAVRFGNGVHAAFSNTQRYSEYWITCCAMPRVAARGTPSVEIFGQEQINASFLSNLCVLVGGAYNSQHVATSGVFAKVMASRKDSREETSFRCAAYGE